MDLSESENIKKYEVVILDLDNTLYDESEYLYSAYRRIGEYIQSLTGYTENPYTPFLIETFEQEGREGLFDKLLSHFNLEQQVTCASILSVLRDNSIVLTVFEPMKELIGQLIGRKQTIYILTNGNPRQQRNKVASLDIQGLLPFIKVVYANEYIPKPSPFCVEEILREEKVSPQHAVLIGDSDIDKITAEQAAIHFIHVNKFIRL